MKKTVLSLALSALLPVSVPATEIKPVEIVITAKGQQSIADVAAISHVITQQQIEKSQSNDVLQLLDTISGISITRNGGRGNTSSTFIRGTDSNQIIVLVDGIRIGSATLGSTELGHIPIEFIERIEVVKGPLSGLYGADAIGGVVQIFTKKSGSGKSLVKLQAGSFGHTKATTGLNTDNFRASISYEDNTGIDVREAGSNDDDGFEETAINIGSNFAISDKTTIAINGFYAENEIEFDSPFGTRPTPNGFFLKNEISTLSANINNSFNDQLNWSTTFGFTNNDTSDDTFQADTERLSLTSQAQYNFSSNSLIIIGGDYYDEKITTSNDFPVINRDNVGVFTQLQNKLGRFGTVANLRFDDNSAYGSDTNGSLALTYSLTNNLRITASYGTAFRAPTFNELYFPGFGNANIQPEESETFEINFRGNIAGSKSSTQWRVSVYDTTIENLIEAPAPAFTAVNTNEATLQGIEFELGTSFGQWNISSSLNLLDATDEATDNELIRRPEQTLKFSATRQFGKFALGTDFLAEKGRFDRGKEELDSFERVDLKAAYQLASNFDITAKIGNLFDEEYQLAKGFNTEGRSLLVSGKVSF